MVHPTIYKSDMSKIRNDVAEAADLAREKELPNKIELYEDVYKDL